MQYVAFGGTSGCSPAEIQGYIKCLADQEIISEDRYGTVAQRDRKRLMEKFRKGLGVRIGRIYYFGQVLNEERLKIAASNIKRRFGLEPVTLELEGLETESEPLTR